jgi:hypothetical protein
MTDSFEIPVKYKGEELLFPAKLLMLGYTHKIEVIVNEIPVLYEPDEERNYRAYIEPATIEKSRNIDINLLQAMAEAIESVVK